VDFSQMLDELIHNAALLRECEEENRECIELESRQDSLLNALLKINPSQKELEANYACMEQKIATLSGLNRKLLRPAAKKKRKTPLTQER